MAKISILIALLPYLLYIVLLNPILGDTNINSTNNNNDDCGITLYYSDETNSLMLTGEKTFPGQWPWIVALYHLIIDERVNKFECSGIILTTKHIITAAGCMSNENDELVDSDNLYVVFGEFFKHQWFTAINRDVEKYSIHPDASSGTSVADLAIVTLRLAVEYSPFIKPICLWSGSTDLENIADRTGYSVGWGTDETDSEYYDESRMIKMPIVNNETCSSVLEFYNQSASENIFCGLHGLLNENNPCGNFYERVVDLGSGLMYFNNNTSRYQLRGIASTMLYTGECTEYREDAQKYVVYVDVTKYKSWIQQQISTT